MSHLDVEKVGGIAGFGGVGGRLRSRGRIDLSALSEAERAEVDALWKPTRDVGESPVRDGFRYRISRPGPKGIETIEVPESQVPGFISRCVKDELI